MNERRHDYLKVVKDEERPSYFENTPISFLGGGFNAARHRDSERRFQIVRPGNITDITIKSPSIPARIGSFLKNIFV